MPRGTSRSATPHIRAHAPRRDELARNKQQFANWRQRERSDAERRLEFVPLPRMAPGMS